MTTGGIAQDPASEWMGIVRDALGDLALEADADAELRALFAGAARRTETEAEGHRNIADTSLGLRVAVEELVAEYRANFGDAAVTHENLQSLMRTRCPFPPFCYGPGEA